MLSRDRNIVSRELNAVAHPVAAGARFHKGAIVALDANANAVPGTATAGLVAVGHCPAAVDNTAGGDGEVDVIAEVDRAFRYDNDAVAPVTRANIFEPCFIKDDCTVSADGTGRSRAGTVVDLDEDGVWIRFEKG